MMKSMRHALPTLGLTLLAGFGLVACGGGGGGGESTLPDAGKSGNDMRQLQGRWQLVNPATTGIVVADSADSATAWLLTQDASQMVRLTLGTAGGTTGRRYDLAAPGGTVENLAGSYAIQLAATPPTVSFASGGVTQVFSRSDAMSGMAAQADAAGTWIASAGAARATWTLTDSGAISGTSTTGCTYGGNTRTPTEVKAYTVDFSENCAGTTRTFSGVATLSADKGRFTVAAVTADGSQGLALFFSKP